MTNDRSVLKITGSDGNIIWKEHGAGYVFSMPRVKCPKHGVHREGCLEVQVDGYKARYCMVCYVEHLADACHRVEPVEDRDEA